MLRAGGQLRPGLELGRRRRRDTDAQLVAKPSVGAWEDGAQRGHERVRRVQRGGAEHPGVHVGRARAHAEVQVDHAADADHEGRLAAADHPAVEDERGVGGTVVRIDPVHDRVPADLLLAVEGEADVHGQRAFLGQLPHGLDEDEHVPLVVGDPTRVEPAVPVGELERRRLPQVERVGRLHVEVRVAENRRRRLGALRSGHLADDERSRAPRHELRAPARPSNLVRHPLRRGDDVGGVACVRAHGRDRDELGELVTECCVRRHGRAVYVERLARRGATRRL